ncbi:MAG: hypothetical protein AAFQ04_05195 [Pseudomonadota bacterium]
MWVTWVGMAARAAIKDFSKGEDGAVTAEWLVIGALVTSLAVSGLAFVYLGATSLADRTAADMGAKSVMLMPVEGLKSHSPEQ